MSNIGKQLIRLPNNISISHQENYLILAKDINIIKVEIPQSLTLKIIGNNLTITPKNGFNTLSPKKIKIVWGTFRSRLYNCILGLGQGFKITLKLVGVGFRASISDNTLQLKLGYSHLILLEIPENIMIKCAKPNVIALQSYNKLALTQYAALIRAHKLPEPYKGKGILYKGEKIIKKEGKKK